jgi:D-lactate dehydrogenase (cytochrome)
VSDHTIHARPPRGAQRTLSLQRDPDVLARFSEDAAHFPGGHAGAVATPETEADIAGILQTCKTVLPVGAQSSLTGGATPMGEVVIATSRMNRIVRVGHDRVRAEAGVTLVELDAALKGAGRFYPPAPTFHGASVGGVTATNAAGPATFKYGTTRSWVCGLSVVLANGEVLDLERGATRAHPDGYIDIALSDRSARIPIPGYRMPAVAKVSAGYFAAPEMDLVDLFVGSEGTLGIITEVTLRIAATRPAACLALVPFEARPDAIAFADELRRAAIETWRTGDPRALDVSAIEHMDARCLELLREDGADHQFGVPLAAAEMALLITLELPPGTTAAQAFDEIGRFREIDTRLARFCRALADWDLLDRVEIAVPGDEARASQLLGLREAVPAAVNARVGRAKLAGDARIAKTAADMIVPFERIGELLDVYDREFRRRQLDAAVWGHISDGNLHPNVIPRSFADVESGREAILTFGREVLRLGGSPLAEHGVGRNSTKQQLLRDLYGGEGIEAMRVIKRTLDPDFKLAPGVIFERS